MGTWTALNTGYPQLTDLYQADIALIAGRIDNLETSFTVANSVNTIDIGGGAVRLQMVKIYLI